MKLIEPGTKLTLIRSAAWSLATRWGMRIVGFINTLVMARLVLPEDYGIVAMSFLVVALIQSLLDFGAATALLRKGVVTTDEINSAWTLRGLQGLVMGFLMVLSIPVAEFYFQDQKVSYVLLVFAFCVSVSGFANIGLTLAQKNFEFSLEFRFQLYAKLLSVFLTIVSGFLFRDYRALVIGIASGYLGAVILSYIMHPYRPKWNTSQIIEIWKITRWLMVANVGGFILRKGDEIAAARIGSASEFGLYNVGADLGQMPTGEVGPAILRSFLPVLASMKGAERDVNAAVLKTLRVIATLTLPLGVGLSVLAEPVTVLLLGENWLGASVYVAIFSIIGAVSSLGGPVSSLMVLRGNTKGLSYIVWTEFVVFVVSAFVLAPLFSLTGLVFARLLGALANLFGMYLLGAIQCRLPFVDLIASIGRPLAGVVFMYFAVMGWNGHSEHGVIGLITSVIVGVFVYSIWIVLSWVFFRRPEGLESLCYEMMIKLRAK